MVERTGEPNQHARDRAEFARSLIQSCPDSLGAEIAIIGSVALGVADEHSDIDLSFYVSELPETTQIISWLQSLYPRSIIPEDNNKVAYICQFNMYTVEFSWQEIGEIEKTLNNLLAGNDTGRLASLTAWNASRALPLRSSGWFTTWREKLSVYPDLVQKSIILTAASFWKYPHRVQMLWTLADRQQTFAQNSWIMADIEDSLRIICAINRQWEPDWKNLSYLAHELHKKPEDMVERINAIFEQTALRDRTRSALEFVLDVLRLVPSHYDVSQQILNISTSLDQR